MLSRFLSIPQEVSVGGPTGLLSFGLQRIPSPNGIGHTGRLVAAPPLPCPRHVAPPGIEQGAPSLTALAYLAPPPYLLGGDSCGSLRLYGASGLISSFHTGSSGPAEIDLIHANLLADKIDETDETETETAGGPRAGLKASVSAPKASLSDLNASVPGLKVSPMGYPPPLRWLVVVAGSGGARTALRYLLTLPVPRAGGAAPPPEPPTWILLNSIELDGVRILLYI